MTLAKLTANVNTLDGSLALYHGFPAVISETTLDEFEAKVRAELNSRQPRPRVGFAYTRKSLENLYIAKKLTDRGVFVFPAKADGMPLIKAWNFHDEMDRDDLETAYRHAWNNAEKSRKASGKASREIEMPAHIGSSRSFKQLVTWFDEKANIIDGRTSSAPLLAFNVPLGINNLVVVDCDRHGVNVDGVENFIASLAEFGFPTDDEALKRYPVVRSSGGGLHMYCRKPEEFAIDDNSFHAFRPAIDIKCGSAYVKGPMQWFEKEGQPRLSLRTSTIGLMHPEGIGTDALPVLPVPIAEELIRTFASRNAGNASAPRVGGVRLGSSAGAYTGPVDWDHPEGVLVRFTSADKRRAKHVHDATGDDGTARDRNRWWLAREMVRAGYGFSEYVRAAREWGEAAVDASRPRDAIERRLREVWGECLGSFEDGNAFEAVDEDDDDAAPVADPFDGFDLDDAFALDAPATALQADALDGYDLDDAFAMPEPEVAPQADDDGPAPVTLEDLKLKGAEVIRGDITREAFAVIRDGAPDNVKSAFFDHLFGDREAKDASGEKSTVPGVTTELDYADALVQIGVTDGWFVDHDSATNPVVWRRESNGLFKRGAFKIFRAHVDDWVKRHLMDGRGTEAIKALGKQRKAGDVVARLSQQALWFASPDRFDAKPYLLGTPGGVVDLRTGEIRYGTDDDAVSMRTAFTPSTAEECPKWHRFIDDFTAGDKALALYLQRTLGGALLGTVGETLPIITGPGGNGKSLLVETINTVVGQYGTNLNKKAIEDNGYEGHDTEIAQLNRKRFVYVDELPPRGRLNEARLKMITGSSVLNGRLMRQDSAEFRNTSRLVIATNHLPMIKREDAWERRIRVIPAPFSGKTKADATLREALWSTEGPGIMRWLVNGARMQFEHEGKPRIGRKNGSGLSWYDLEAAAGTLPEAVRKATADYWTDLDHVARFIAICPKVGSNTASASLLDLFDAFATFAADMGGVRQRGLVTLNRVTYSQQTFAEELRRLGLAIERTMRTRKAVLGIGLPDLDDGSFENCTCESDDAALQLAA